MDRKEYTIGMISLGCPKNQVDGELMLAALRDAGYAVSPRTDDCDLVIVNTCGFIEDAKREAIENILYAAGLKADGVISKVLVTGCLAQRYENEVADEFPEVDGVIGIGANSDIVTVVDSVFGGERVVAFPSKYCLPLNGTRMLSTPGHYAYLKIAEGCSNGCAYCAIPAIRGKLRSRPVEDIVAEAKALALSGVKEIIIIAQDVTKYGLDLYGELSLARLLRELARVDGIKWIRLLYCYPDALTDELIDLIASEEKICSYIDLPLQHASADVLRRMRRRYTPEEYRRACETLRRFMPDCAVTTDVIVGFPGETEAEFQETLDFVRAVRLARIHVFPYSRRKGTVADAMEGHVPEAVKHERARALIEVGNRLEAEFVQGLVGTVQQVLFEQPAGEGLAEGYTSQYVRVRAGAGPGELKSVRIERAEGTTAFGSAVD